jgi:transposase
LFSLTKLGRRRIEDGRRQKNSAAVCHLPSLPAYSPDLNPIENVFAKLKALVRKLKLRSVESLWRKLGELCDVFTPQEWRNYFQLAGYNARKTP